MGRTAAHALCSATIVDNRRMALSAGSGRCDKMRPSPLGSNAARPLKATLATDELDNRSRPFMSKFQKQGAGQRRMRRLVACFRPIGVPRDLARCCSQ